MPTTDVPDLVSPEDAVALRRYLAWHALAAEFMCGIVARGIPLAPTRDQRRALMHQIRTENSQADWLVKRVHELHGEVPEQDEGLRNLQQELAVLSDRSWLEYLACAQVAMRAYMNPYLRALAVIYRVDEEFEGFSREVLVPEIASHFKRALGDLRLELEQYNASERSAALATARNAEQKAFDVFLRFIATSYPALEALNVDTAGLQDELVASRLRFWEKLEASLVGAA
jgi:hypothetical protein